MMTSLAPSRDGRAGGTVPPALARPLPARVTLLLRAEGAAALAVAIVAYAALGRSWLVFALVLLLPDLAMVGYAFGPKLGAHLYNAAHTYVAPALLAALGHGLGLPLLLGLACVWVAHIGMDRALGFGLKHEASFGDTHLGRAGRG